MPHYIFCAKTANNGWSKIHSLNKLHKAELDQVTYDPLFTEEWYVLN